MSTYVKVTMIFDNQHIRANPNGFMKDIKRDLGMIFKTKMVVEPEVWAINVLDSEDYDVQEPTV